MKRGTDVALVAILYAVDGIESVPRDRNMVKTHLSMGISENIFPRNPSIPPLGTHHTCLLPGPCDSIATEGWTWNVVCVYNPVVNRTTDKEFYIKIYAALFATFLL